MGRPLLKGLAVTAVGIGAIVICYMGYQANASHQYEQRVQYANKAIENGQEKLAAIDKTIGLFYVDDQQVFLREDLEDGELTSERGKLEAVKVDAEEYNIQTKDLASDTKKIQETKAALTKKIALVEDKLAVQNKTNELFEKSVSSWQEPVNDVVIKEDLTDEAIGNIREDLKLMMIDDQWKKNITDYLDFADAQLTRIKDIEKSIGEMLKDGQITENATYESYLSLADSISQVRNESKKADFTKSLNTISEQLGYGGVSSDDGGASDSSDTYSEEDTGYDEEAYTEDYE
ncbi:hypothetical protein [Enterococcus diestrammenae]|uniref:hypothetical protein n=1 Tax=Enterococcus diestrammenae TaxID=1155073 RepID=UPI00195F1931